MILYIDACVRKDSRTKMLADCLLHTLDEPYETLKLPECDFPTVDEDFLAERDRLVSEGALSDPVLKYAVQFAKADAVVIAAPCWDLSFPSLLKVYLEQINVTGVTFFYTPEGIPQGLCKAEKLYYVTTVGGEFFPEQFGFGYVEALAQNFYGIRDVELIKAMGLDIIGAPVEKILQDCREDIVRRFRKDS